MPKPSTLKKYLRLVKLLEDSPARYISLSHIKYHLTGHGFASISDRTLLRDFDTLREEFGIPVSYCQRNKGWYLNSGADEDLGDYRQFIKLLELAERVETITCTFQERAAASRSIVFEQREYFKGSHHLSALVEAIGRKIVIHFSYQSYEKAKARPYQVEPYLVKEYSNRWYLPGWDLQAGKLKTFGLDRIEAITFSGELIAGTRDFQYKTLFEHTFGITCLDEEPQRVVLSFTAKQGHYIKSLPLHASQQLLLDTATEYRIALQVVINYELKKEILSYGDSVKVLEPLALRKELIANIKSTLGKYDAKQSIDVNSNKDYI
jgi:predicted DNA-binding transcriptional regulator YafY